MYGFINGITDTDNISYCPKCGAEIKEYRGDGTAVCEECNFHFGEVDIGDLKQYLAAGAGGGSHG